MLLNPSRHAGARSNYSTPPITMPDSRRCNSLSCISVAKSALISMLLASAGAAVAAQPQPFVANDACKLADTPPTGALLRVPFDTVDGRIYVEARVNGHGPFRFAVDTGASGMARADASLVASLSLATHGEASTSDGVKTATVKTTRLDSLELGGFIRRDLDVIARDYNSRNSLDAAFAGIIAREYFSDGLLTIDYPRKTLSFSRAQRLSAHANNVLNYERAFRIPVSIGTLQTVGQLDTGADVAFVLPRSMYDKVATSAMEQEGHAQLTNGRIDTARATVSGPFRIGGITMSDVEVRVSDKFPELLVGAGALQNSVVLIDQRSKSVAVCAAKDLSPGTESDSTSVRL